MATMLLGCLLGADVSAVLPAGTGGQTEATAESSPPHLVAVPRFVDASGADAGDLGSRLANAVAADLEQRDTFSIVGPESFGRQARSDAPEGSADSDAVARRVARENGVGWLVAGRFEHVGTQLCITVRIVSINPRTATLTISLDGGVADLTELEDRLVSEVGRGLLCGVSLMWTT